MVIWYYFYFSFLFLIFLLLLLFLLKFVSYYFVFMLLLLWCFYLFHCLSVRLSRSSYVFFLFWLFIINHFRFGLFLFFYKTLKIIIFNYTWSFRFNAIIFIFTILWHYTFVSSSLIHWLCDRMMNIFRVYVCVGVSPYSINYDRYQKKKKLTARIRIIIEKGGGANCYFCVELLLGYIWIIICQWSRKRSRKKW